MEYVYEQNNIKIMFMSSLAFLLLQRFAPLLVGVDSYACHNLSGFASVKCLVLQFIVFLL
jgi:hypothetical protein